MRMRNEVTQRRRVFLLWGVMCSGLAVTGNVVELSLGNIDLADEPHWFGLTGFASFVVAMLVLLPIWFLMGGLFGVFGRWMISSGLSSLGPEKRERLGWFRTKTPEWTWWWYRVLLGIDRDGSRLS